MKTVLITGGSSGIGFETSRHFAKNGYQILWVSLLEKEIQKAKLALLKQFPTCIIQSFTLDLAQADSAKKVHTWVKENSWTIDVLINNAGFGTYGFLQETAIDKELNMINLNLINVYKMTRFFLDDMLLINAGTIINISSNSSFQPVPKMTTYASTKAFIAHFSKSLNEELKIQKSAVRVMTVLPAAIRDTNFKAVANMNRVKTFDGLAVTTAEEVAQDLWNGFSNKKDIVISGWKMRLIASFQHLIPSRIAQFMVNREVKEI